MTERHCSSCHRPSDNVRLRSPTIANAKRRETALPKPARLCNGCTGVLHNRLLSFKKSDWRVVPEDKEMP